MQSTLTVRDETTSGESLNEFELEFDRERITVEELIRNRVYQEVKDFNVRQNSREFRGLIQPTNAEATLNGYRLKKRRQIDWQKQFDKATEAFQNNQILILINDHQAESLHTRAGARRRSASACRVVGIYTP